MAFKLTVVIFATIFISTHIHSVCCQPFEIPGFSFFGYGKWGIGPCPKVTPMKDFDITRLYGGAWYMIAHYSEPSFFDSHCTEIQVSDGNQGSDICRVLGTVSSVGYGDGKLKSQEFSFLLPNETTDASWIDGFHDYPVKSYVLDTDYKDYIFIHECNQYPRDNPFLYEQHNYINSRQPVWPDGLKSFQKGLKIFESYRIDTGYFVSHDQKDCVRISENVQN